MSPANHYAATTDRSGHFSLVGVELDTYTISVQRQGYGPYSVAGATITADETYRFDVALTKELRTLARTVTRGRPTTSAFQPNQTVDRYTVNSAGIEQLIGKTYDTNGKELLSELPSVTVDRNGTALIRGGTSFQGAFQFEGIDYTEPNQNLTDRFENVGSNYLLNGVGSVEIIPGGGDATHGNTGTGLIAVTAKRGTYPAFGNVDYEVGTLGVAQQEGFEYGIATRNQRLSNYVSYTSEATRNQYGQYGLDPRTILDDPTTENPNLETLYTAGERGIYTTAFFNQASQNSHDILDNAIFRFGKNGSQTLQFFIQNQVVHQTLDYGGASVLTAVPQTLFYTLNPLVNPNASGINSLDSLFGGHSLTEGYNYSQQQFIDRFAPQVFGATPGQALNSPEKIDSPFSAYKIEYDSNIGATTALGLRAYRTDDAATEVLPSQGLYIPQSGGTRRGIAFDVTEAPGSRHTFQVGGKYEFVTPFGERINDIDYTGALEGVYTSIGPAEINVGPFTHDVLADFVQPQPVETNVLTGQQTGTPGCLGSGPQIGGTPPQEHCGYLYRYFPNGPPALPAEIEVPTAHQQNYGLYFQDTYAPSARFRLLGGVRLDGYNFQLPSDPTDPPAVDGIRHQRLYEPHTGFTYRLGDRDAIRANFGRTLSIPLPTFLGQDIQRSEFNAYAGIPSYDSVTGKAAVYCGPGKPMLFAGQTVPEYIGNQPCTSYADQLYWLFRNARYGEQNQITFPLQGATFTNYDFSYSHEFPSGVALKLTPFYRRGYDIVETSQTLLGIDAFSGTQLLSPQIQSNLGVQSAAGIEFEATSPLKPTGLSATFSATYINQIGNDPPGSYLPTASIQLGELYRSPNLAPFQSTLAMTYRTKWGLRVNPIFTFHSGYPYGSGTVEAFTLSGQPYYVPYTDALFVNAYASTLSACAVNPQNPGTFTNPNCSALRGLEAVTSGPGSLLSHPTLNTDLTVELTPRNGPRGLTYGIAIQNLFDDLASLPYANLSTRCALVYTGLCASDGSATISDPTHKTPTTLNAANSPYIVYPNQAPIAIRLFVQAGI